MIWKWREQPNLLFWARAWRRQSKHPSKLSALLSTAVIFSFFKASLRLSAWITQKRKANSGYGLSVVPYGIKVQISKDKARPRTVLTRDHNSFVSLVLKCWQGTKLKRVHFQSSFWFHTVVKTFKKPYLCPFFSKSNKDKLILPWETAIWLESNWVFLAERGF